MPPVARKQMTAAWGPPPVSSAGSDVATSEGWDANGGDTDGASATTSVTFLQADDMTELNQSCNVRAADRASETTSSARAGESGQPWSRGRSLDVAFLRYSSLP